MKIYLLIYALFLALLGVMSMVCPLPQSYMYSKNPESVQIISDEVYKKSQFLEGISLFAYAILLVLPKKIISKGKIFYLSFLVYIVSPFIFFRLYQKVWDEIVGIHSLIDFLLFFSGQLMMLFPVYLPPVFALILLIRSRKEQFASSS